MIAQRAVTGTFISLTWMIMKYLCRSAFVTVKIMKRRNEP